MKIAVIFLICAAVIIAVTAAPAPDLLPEQPVIPARGAPYVRVARANPEPKKDLDGAESYYVGYPYYYPYWGHHYVLVGK